MKLDVTELLNKRKDSLDFFYDLLPTGDEGWALLPEGVELAAPAKVDCLAEDVNGYIRLSFDVSADLKCRCTRCLDELVYPLDISFERFAGQSPEEIWGGSDEDGMEEDVLDIVDSGVFPDGAIMEELSLAAPEYCLCSDDCAGLCSRCGKKVAECSCAPKEEKRSDPRMDVFRDLLLKMEEEEKGEDKNN